MLLINSFKWMLILLFPFFLQSCLEFRQSDRDMFKSIATRKYKPKISYYDTLNRHIRYMEIGNDSLPTVIFVHGSPSSMNFFNNYFKDSTLLEHCKMVGIDRPGYGYSDFGNIEPSIEQQAKFLAPIVQRIRKKNKRKKTILLSSSYGGPVIAKIAMDNRRDIDGILFVAPALDPENEMRFWFNRPLKNKFIRFFMPKTFCMANDEKEAHAQELQKILSGWENIKVKHVFYLQGEQDDIVSIKNLKFAKEKLKYTDFQSELVPKRKHTLIYEEEKLVKQRLLKLIGQVADDIEHK
jgi:pimeloyl-ACP methyl ester carboxylesterase